ncbi:ninjurin-1-like isoform X4 [Centruroides vittatus]|uniref:ninjurin-1-like isoform X4 n=1 Tax=Centruroides vittatus TaxID=120091 RepID=UPI0035101349
MSGSNVVSHPDLTGAVKPRALDANVYATKKSVAQGLLDVALLTANASQLKYLLRVGDRHEFFYPMMVLVCLSIVLQIAVGALIVVLGSTDLNQAKNHRKADVLNNVVTLFIFFISIVNILISAFGMQETDQIVF